MTENRDNIEIWLDGRRGCVACISGWRRNGYFGVSVTKKTLTQHAFTTAVNAEFPDAERLEVRSNGGKYGWWVATGKLEASDWGGGGTEEEKHGDVQD